MYTVYVLKLKENKYYVGKTKKLEYPLNPGSEHSVFFVNDWVKKYGPPQATLEIIEGCNESDEDAYTLKYMKIYGIGNVRGGRFWRIVLDEQTILALNKTVPLIKDRCFECEKKRLYTTPLIKK